MQYLQSTASPLWEFFFHLRVVGVFFFFCDRTINLLPSVAHPASPRVRRVSCLSLSAMHCVRLQDIFPVINHFKVIPVGVIRQTKPLQLPSEIAVEINE